MWFPIVIYVDSGLEGIRKFKDRGSEVFKRIGEATQPIFQKEHTCSMGRSFRNHQGKLQPIKTNTSIACMIITRARSHWQLTHMHTPT